MNTTDYPSIAGEDTVDIPESWASELLDRRGRGTPRPVEIGPDAVRELQNRFARYENDIERALARLEDPSYEAPIRAGIAGTGDPLEAALAAQLLSRAAAGRRRDVGDPTRAWIAGRGVGFAAEAVLELAAHLVVWYAYHGGDGPVSIRTVDVSSLFRSPETVRCIEPLRSILAALPDEEYETVRAAVDRRRTTEAHRFAAAMLMPEQEDWTREAVKLYAASRKRWSVTDSLWVMVSSGVHVELADVTKLDRYQAHNGGVARVVDALGADALPILVATLDDDERPSAEFRDEAYDAIGRLPSEDAIGFLIERSSLPQAAAALKAAAARFPVRTLRAVAARWTTATVFLKARLAGLVRAELADRMSELEPPDRSAIERLLQSTRPAPPAETAPPVFTTPPWTPFKPSAKKTAADGLTPPPVDELRWAEDERRSWAEGVGSPYEGRHYLKTEGFWQRSPWGATIAPGHYYFMDMLAWAPDEVALPGYERWEGAADTASLATVRAILARYGEAAAPRIQELIAKKPSCRPALLPFVNLGAARMAAAWVSRSRTDRAHGRAWLDRHPAEAAAFLIPDALGKNAKERQSAEGALRYLAAEHRETLDKAAAAYGPGAAEAVAAIVDADPLDPRRRVPKPAAWADPAMLPPVLLSDGRGRLPDDATRTLMTALALDDPDRLYPGADLLAAECDPASLTAFSWALFELWAAAGSPTKDGWAMDQLRRFADDDTVRRLTALIREWPGQGQSRKAVRGLETLGHIGSEASLRAVQGIAANGEFKSLKKTAAAQIEVIAERLELTLDQLADRLVPDFGLSSDEPLVLDYGPRSFTVRFDEQLKPYLVDERGKRRASAPKPAAKDDQERAQAAHERFTTLRKELKTTAAEQVRRLEAAMVDQRSWSPAEFGRRLVDHPLMWQLARRLVFQATAGASSTSFRLAEDRTLADLDDELFELPEDAAVRVAHPLSLGGELADWAEVFADYEILQPFEQLARPVLTLTDEERSSGRLARFEGAKVGAGPIIGLLRRGWRYGTPTGSRYSYCVYHEFPEGGWLVIDPSPGVHPGYGDDGDQVLREVAVALPEDGAVDPVRLSEALAVVARLARAV
ncbi:DUF4132 domain-containing protein [Glycomyces tenuis]|uniref:DUF4132 domain-containing protein n=3 Tax=Glycomyces tenuis TaxID=58116 RepID=UPI00041431E6|nr:DUF4132 domain-containing protein [Glycomyces tenuis]